MFAMGQTFTSVFVTTLRFPAAGCATALPLRLERAVAHSPHPNRLLASLSPADFELVRPHLKTVDLIQGTVLFEAGDPVNRVYFPHSGIISLVVPMANGEMIEAAMIGRDSVVGGSSALGTRLR